MKLRKRKRNKKLNLGVQIRYSQTIYNRRLHRIKNYSLHLATRIDFHISSRMNINQQDTQLSS